MATQTNPNQNGSLVQLEDSPVSKFLFSDVRLSWLWLIVRVYVGYEWLVAGWAKVQNPAWFGGGAGAALTGFVKGALTKSTGAHADVQGWYAAFLQNMVLPNVGFWSNFVAVGEVLVGIALILGIFTGIAAFFGSFMNFNYLLAGTVSTNPILFLLAMLIILAWKTAGWLGLDRWILPLFGTPWTPGKVFKSSGK
jgi:thiosulfate dehydrogenase (quinone) large subunit